MWPIQRQLLPVSSANFCSSLIPSSSSHSSRFSFRAPATVYRYSLCSAHRAWVTQVSEKLTTGAAALTPSEASPVEGPVELSPSMPSIFATSDDPTLLQTATSVLLTGAITVFLFRSLRRRAKRAKETKLRSAGEKKSLKEEALESLKTVSLSPLKTKSTPSPVQAFLGSLAAAVIALILYKFTTTIEASLNRQTISDDYSVRQITITDNLPSTPLWKETPVKINHRQFHPIHNYVIQILLELQVLMVIKVLMILQNSALKGSTYFTCYFVVLNEIFVL